MSTTWKAGDRAMCITAFEGLTENALIPSYDPLPVVGVVYLVTEVNTKSRSGVLGLWLAALPSRRSYVAYKFRKLIPACDRADVGQEVVGDVAHEAKPSKPHVQPEVFPRPYKR